MRKFKGRVLLVVATGLAVGAAILLWQHGQPRRAALLAVSKLADNLANNHGAELLERILIPVAIQSRTQSEQEQFLAKALADEIRLRILNILVIREMCVCEVLVALQLTQPTASHHLAILENAGLVKKRKEGKWVLYRVSDPELVVGLRKLGLL